MKVLFWVGLLSGLIAAGQAGAQIQVIDLGMESSSAEEVSKTKPSVDSLPEIKDLQAEQKEKTTEEQEEKPSQTTTSSKEEEKGFFSFLNFLKKEDKEKGKEDAQSPQETLQESLERRAKEGNLDAQLTLGYMYLYGDETSQITPDYKKSFEYYSMAAEQGDNIAINNLGSLYYSGIGTEKNMSKAAELFAIAADKGNEESALNLGFLYLSGNGVKQDNRKAMDYFVQAGQKGNLAAQFMLGYAYYRGFIVPQDYKRAFALMKDAAKAGYDDAQFFMGLMYLSGDGVTKNYGNAVKYLGNAFLQGNVNATMHLADIYAEGRAYPKNIFQAYTLYNIAANNGIEIAQEKRDALEKTLKIEEILSAQAEAENFVPKPTELTTYIRKTFGTNIFSYIADQLPEQYIEKPTGTLNETSQKLL